MRIQIPQSRRRMDRVTINLASMIDVSFLLLFYFMVASMLEDRETRLSAGLAKPSRELSTTAADLQPQVVEVRQADAGPSYRLGARTMRSRGELVAALGSLPKGPGLFVKVFDDVPVGFAVAAVQAGRDAGFEQVTYVPAR